MKNKFTKSLLLAVIMFLTLPMVFGQDKSNKGANEYPSSFLISLVDVKDLLGRKVYEVIKNKNNKYLDGGIIMANTKNGDMQYLKLKLAYFRKAFLNIQVNGTNSTQVFITSDDKSIFYKGTLEKENAVMIKCSEDEIISE